jgi:hypothetical protein
VLHTQCFSLTHPRSVIRDDRNKPDLIDNTSMRRISMGVDVISGHSIVDRSQEMPSASFFFFFTSLAEFRLHQVAYIYFFFFFSGLPLTDFLRCLVTQKKRSYPYLPMGQPVERKWGREWNRSDFQCLIRVKK